MKKLVPFAFLLGIGLITLTGCPSSNSSSSPTSPAAPTNTPAAPTSTPAATGTATNTATSSATAVATSTATKSPTGTATMTPTATATSTLVNTGTPTSSATNSATSTVTLTATNTTTPIPTSTPTSSATDTTTPICSFQPTSTAVVASGSNTTSGTAINLGTLGTGDMVMRGSLSGSNPNEWFVFTAGSGVVRAGLSIDCFDDGTESNKFLAAAYNSSLTFVVETSGGGVPSVQSSGFSVTSGQTYYVDAAQISGSGNYRVVLTGLAATPTLTPSSTSTNTATLTPTSTITNTPTLTATSTITMTPTATQGWHVFGTPDFSTGAASYLNLSAVSGIYVAYEDGTNNKGTVVQYNSPSWSPVGSASGFTPSTANYLSFVPGSTGLYAAYVDGTTGYSQAQTYASSWNLLGSTPATQCTYTSLGLDSYNNVPYLAYTDNLATNKVAVLKYSAGSWSTVGTPGFTGSTAQYLNMGVYSNATTTAPYLAYEDGNNGNALSVMYYNGTSWQYAGGSGALSPGIVTYVSMALDISTGQPWVAYSDGYGTAGGKCTVMHFNGASWSTVGNADFTPGSATAISLAVVSGTPYVAFQDGNAANYASVMKYSGGNWVNVGAAGFSGGVVTSVSLSLNGSTPYVAFDDGANSGKAKVMYFQ